MHTARSRQDYAQTALSSQPLEASLIVVLTSVDSTSNGGSFGAPPTMRPSPWIPLSAEAPLGSHVLVMGIFGQQAGECVLLSRSRPGSTLCV